jgi:hypothetical protein
MWNTAKHVNAPFSAAKPRAQMGEPTNPLETLMEYGVVDHGGVPVDVSDSLAQRSRSGSTSAPSSRASGARLTDEMGHLEIEPKSHIRVSNAIAGAIISANSETIRQVNIATRTPFSRSLPVFSFFRFAVNDVEM